MVQNPWHITLILYASMLKFYAEADVCYTVYDVQLACHDCCYGTPLAEYNNVSSAIACSELCSKNNECRSMQYDPNTKYCWTNEEKLTSVNTSCSNLIRYGENKLNTSGGMFEPCNCHADCVIANSTCRNGKCECQDGHPYDHRTDSCPTHCTNYGHTFHAVSYILNGYSAKVYYSLSEDECVQKCLLTTDFVCRFLEYMDDCQNPGILMSHGCFLSDYNGLTKRTAPRYPSPSCKAWERNCA